MEEDKIVLDRKSFEALAVDSRVKILKSLKERRKTLSELAEEQKMSVSGVKEHLEILEKVGLVEKIDDGHKWKYYELTKKGNDIIGPKELRVWILLSLSSVALILSIFAMLPAPMASEMPMADGGADFAENAPMPEVAGSADAAEPRLMAAAPGTDAKTVPTAEEPKQDPALLAVAGISVVTMAACLAILVRNRLKPKATV
ncbi:MAG: winged helix-turn-helix domain-containing protein [Candidatus ainarchaeum sp.]|nr:winged helix-turn-helix domain-containing protein [Candidatus ainarchaeum sp.]